MQGWQMLFHHGWLLPSEKILRQIIINLIFYSRFSKIKDVSNNTPIIQYNNHYNALQGMDTHPCIVISEDFSTTLLWLCSKIFSTNTLIFFTSEFICNYCRPWVLVLSLNGQSRCRISFQPSTSHTWSAKSWSTD